MKRILLGLVMLSSLALMAAPKANAALIECGKAYAIEFHGAEPSTSNGAALKYVAGVGQITFNAAGTFGTTGCTVGHMEVIYNDNDFTGFLAAPAGCYDAGSLSTEGVACFDGGSHGTGNLGPSTFGNGALTLNITPTFTWIDGAPMAGSLPLSFTLQSGTGGAIVYGNSVALPGPSLPTGTPPENPVLVIQLQHQNNTTVTFPVTGVDPTNCGPYGCSGTTTATKNGYGVAPYLGQAASLFQGFGGTNSVSAGQGVEGSFGSTISPLQIFSNGAGGGSASFSSNDNVGNTTGAVDSDCDTVVFQTGNFADGTNNDTAAIVGPASPTCANFFGGVSFTLSSVLWGATDTSNFTAVTAAATAATSGLLTPGSGLIADGTSIAQSPPGKLTSSATANVSLKSVSGLVTRVINTTSTTPSPCAVLITMAAASDASCSLSLAGGSPVSLIKEGDAPLAPAATIDCTCTAADPTGVTSSLTVSPDPSGPSDLPGGAECPVSIGAGPISVNCHR